jgi:hypothetical protein
VKRSCSSGRDVRRPVFALGVFAAALMAPMSATAVDRETVDLSNGGGLAAFRLDNVLNIGTLSLDRSGILLFGCLGETCSGFAPFVPLAFTLNVSGTATLNEASFLTTASPLPPNVLSVDVNFNGPSVMTGTTDFDGAYEGSVAQGLVNFTNTSNMVQRGGTATLTDAFFHNRGSYVLRDGATFAVAGGGGTAPPNAALPKFGFVNDGGLLVESPPIFPGSPSSTPPSFIEYLYNNGTVTVEGPAPATLRIGGGRHRNALFESTAPATGGIEYAGLHEFEGTTTFGGHHRLLSGSTTGSGAGPARFEFGYGAEAAVDGTLNIGDGAFLGLSGTATNIVTATAGATLTLLRNSSVVVGIGGTLAARKGSHVHVAGGGQLVIDGTFDVEATINTRPSPPASILNKGEVLVTGSVTGTAEIVNDGRLRVAPGALVEATSLVSSGILDVDGTIGTTGGDVTVLGGILQGSGIINADLNVQRGGIATTVVFPGNSPGMLTVNGAFRLEAGAELVLEVERLANGGLAFDRLWADTTFLDGIVRLRLGAGIDPLRDRLLLSTLPFFACQPVLGLPTCDFSENFTAFVDGYTSSTVLATPSGGLLIVAVGPLIPEAHTWLLMALGMGVVASQQGGRRRRIGQIPEHDRPC